MFAYGLATILAIVSFLAGGSVVLGFFFVSLVVLMLVSEINVGLEARAAVFAADERRVKREAAQQGPAQDAGPTS